MHPNADVSPDGVPPDVPEDIREEVFAKLRAVYAELDRKTAALLAERENVSATEITEITETKRRGERRLTAGSLPSETSVSSVASGCRACGTCCSFPPEGDVLYASAVERELLASVPPPPGPHPEGSCPYLREGRCAARERRTVGCRAYYCVFVLPSQAARDECRSLGEWALSEVRRIAEESGLDWDYAPVVKRLAARGIR